MSEAAASRINANPGTPPAEVEIHEELVRHLIEDQHSDLTGPLEPLESGWDNDLYRLQSKYIVRLPRRVAAAALIRHEQRWLPELAPRLPLPVPVPIRVGEPGRGYPWRWSITPWLDGTAADREPLLATEAEVLTDFLKALHLPAPDDAPANEVRGVPLGDRASAIEPRLHRLKLRGSHRDLVMAAHELWMEAQAVPIDVEPTWLHGDLHARNVLVSGGKLCGIIDWGDMTKGDPATDLASLWMLLPTPESRRWAMERYKTSADTWLRAKGWALFFGIFLLETGLTDHPRHAEMGAHTLRQVLAGP